MSICIRTERYIREVIRTNGECLLFFHPPTLDAGKWVVLILLPREMGAMNDFSDWEQKNLVVPLQKMRREYFFLLPSGRITTQVSVAFLQHIWIIDGIHANLFFNNRSIFYQGISDWLTNKLPINPFKVFHWRVSNTISFREFNTQQIWWIFRGEEGDPIKNIARDTIIQIIPATQILTINESRQLMRQY